MSSAKVVRTLREAGLSIALRHEGARWDIVVGNVVLLSSAALGTELSFGRLVADLVGADARRVIVGGLGFGATARGVLEAAPNARVVVVEKLRAIPELLRGELAHLAEGVLDDPRVELVQGDVTDAIAREKRGAVDAILLDVDNGPDWASFRTNARLYAPAGLASAKAALRAGGALAVWSGYRADAFIKRLRTAGFEPKIVPLFERGSVRARAYVGVYRGRA